jgi:putative ABC transport system permease protein
MVLVVFGGTATVVATAGRNTGAEAAVLSRVDARGTRTLTVYVQGAQPDFTTRLIPDLVRYEVVQEVVGLGPVVDVTSAATPTGGRVGMRSIYGTLNGKPFVPRRPVAGMPLAAASTDALAVLGMPQGRGTVRAIDGREALITGEVTLPDYLAGVAPVVAVPGDVASGERLAALTVLARRPQDLPLVSTLVSAALADVPREKVRVQSSEGLAELRAAIGGELTSQNRAIIFGTTGASAAAMLTVVWATALMRRRDFGRRRALGATRAVIVGLMTSQVCLVSGVGTSAGAGAGLGWLAATGKPLPGLEFLAALVFGFTLIATAAAAAPACWAATRDPVIELRVP